MLPGARLWCVGDSQEKEQDNHGKTADGQIDVEAPAPCHVVCKCTTHQRSDDRRNPKYGPHQPDEDGPFGKRHDLCDYYCCAGKYACRSHTCYRASHDEGLGVWRAAADGRSDFKNKDCDQEDGLGRVEGVHLAPG